MSSPVRSMLSLAFQACRVVDPEVLYDCLTSHIGVSIPIRSRKEVLIRMLAVHVISLVSYGHLLSMQGFFKTRPPPLAYLSLLLFFFFPQLSIIQLLFRSIMVVLSIAHERTRRRPLRYYFAACLGVHVNICGRLKAIQLKGLGLSELRFEKRKYHIIWLGRIFVLLGLLAQYCGSLAIWYRNVSLVSHWNNWFLPFDSRDYEMTLGGAVAVINSILIALLNTEWEYTPVHSANVLLRDRGWSMEDSGTHSCCPRSYLSTAFSVPEASSPQEPSTKLHSIVQSVYRKNESFLDSLSTLFPASVQFGVEHAVILQNIIEICHFAPLDEWSDCCAETLKDFWIRAVTGEKNACCPPRTYIDAWYHMTVPLWTRRKYSRPGYSWFILTYYIFIVRIILGDALWLLIRCRITTTFMPKASKGFSSVHSWITSGRSLFSFPLFVGLFMGVALRVYVMFDHSVLISRFQPGSTQYMEDEWCRLWASLSMYKDPWYDNMYVL